MRCKKTEKWISDGIDGNLSPKKQEALAAHLTKCSACRAYRLRLGKIDEGAKSLSAPALSPEFWRTSIDRLKANLEAAPSAKHKEFNLRPRQAPAFFPVMRWAWAGAASVLAVAVGLYFMIFAVKTPLEIYHFTFEETVNGLYETIGDNPDLENEFNSMLQASISEHADESAVEIKHLLYGNSFFIESLSDEEINLLDSHLKSELKIKI